MNEYADDFNATGTRRILAAAFPTPDGGARAAVGLVGALPGRVGNTAVLHVEPNGDPKFVETKDWGGGRGALVGGLVGIIGGPLGMLAGSGIGAVAAKLHDNGFRDAQLRRLAGSLGPNGSAVVLELDGGVVGEAQGIVESLGAWRVVVEPAGGDVSDLFRELRVYESEAEVVRS